MVTIVINVAIVIIFALIVSGFYLTGTVIKSFASFFASIIAMILSFNFYEQVSNQLITRGWITNYAAPLSFALIFALAFALLRVSMEPIIKSEVKFPAIYEHIGNTVIGILVSVIVSGALCIVLAMVPFGTYKRFPVVTEDNVPTVMSAQLELKPNKSMGNLDGMLTNIASFISKGSFAGTNSFNVTHPDFVNSLYLDKHMVSKEVPTISGKNSIEILSIEDAPQRIRYSDNKQVEEISKHELKFAKISFKSNSIDKGGVMLKPGKFEFIPAQLRLICQENNSVKSAQAVYPFAIVDSSRRLDKKKLLDTIEYSKDDFNKDGKKLILNIAFYVPQGHKPIGINFRNNGFADLKITQPETEKESDPK